MSEKIGRDCLDCGNRKEMVGNTQGKRWGDACLARRIKNQRQSYRFHHRLYDLRTRYGITGDEYFAMLHQQDGKCAVCKQVCSSGQALGVAHCHHTNKVRGLLCKRCNMALHFLENPEWLTAAKTYLWKDIA